MTQPPAQITLPELISVCGLCHGHGYHKHHYCDAPDFNGDCDVCKGQQFVYTESVEPVPSSVRDQIANTNGLTIQNIAMAGLYLLPASWLGYLGHRHYCYEEIPVLMERKA